MAQTTLGDGLIIGAGDHITFGDSTVLASSPNGLKNVLINPNFAIDQRNTGAAQTITAAAALAYTVDRWYGYCTGANVTGQRVAGTAPNQYNYRYTGAGSVTKIGHAQRIEAANSQHLAGTTATLSVDLANSILTTVTWTAWYANSADTFGTLASPTRTSIGTGTFTVTSTLTRYNAQISIPAGATTGIEIEFSVGAQTSGTWTIGNVQLESGSVATPFETRSIGTELALCQRYYWKTVPAIASIQFTAACYSTVLCQGEYRLPVPMRVTPTSAGYSGTPGNWRVDISNAQATATSFSVSAINTQQVALSVGYAATGAGGNAAKVMNNLGADYLYAEAEL